MNKFFVGMFLMIFLVGVAGATNEWCGNTDVNRDFVINQLDEDYVRSIEINNPYWNISCDASNTYCDKADINRDGVVSAIDRAIITDCFGYEISRISCSKADYDKDGDVDAMDILKFNQCNVNSAQYISGSTSPCYLFDFNGDGIVNYLDGDLMSEWTWKTCEVTCLDTLGKVNIIADQGYTSLNRKTGEIKIQVAVGAIKVEKIKFIFSMSGNSFIEIWEDNPSNNEEKVFTLKDNRFIISDDVEVMVEILPVLLINNTEENCQVSDSLGFAGVTQDGVFGDLDNGDYYEKGICVDENGESEDDCLSGEYEGWVREYNYDLGYGCGSSDYQCPNGCENGACKEGNLTEDDLYNTFSGEGKYKMKTQDYVKVNGVKIRLLKISKYNSEDRYFAEFQNTKNAVVSDLYEGDSYKFDAGSASHSLDYGMNIVVNSINIEENYLDSTVFVTVSSFGDNEESGGGSQEGSENLSDNFDWCSGCFLDDKCYDLGYRKSINGTLRYCSEIGFVVQKAGDETCDNHFECESNVCVSGKCVEAGLIQKILNWFKRLFG